ncbi:MAG: DUF308 domain-containing protein [Bacteroidales bacterium]|nr:DUF308 domain-containing protein [Bacteroidales bacterium]
MKNAIIRVLFAMAVGLTLILWPDEATRYLVIATGILFILPSVISFLISLFSRNKRFPFEGIGSLLLGVWFIAMPDMFANLLMYILGGILIIAGAHQTISLLIARKWTPVSLFFYITPILILAAGIIVVCNPESIRNFVFLIIGILCLIYAASELLNAILFLRKKPSPKTHIDKSNIEDAEVIEE